VASKPVEVSASGASSDAVFQTLKWCEARGFKAVAIRYQSKAALDQKYVREDYVTPPLELWQKRKLGVGVVTGPKAGGPVDTDLDCEEAVFFAKRFLPETKAVFGRETKPDSHYLYRIDADDVEKKAFIDPVRKETIIEIRGGGGHQTVLPGSLHEDTGEEIKWSSTPFPEVPVVGYEVLLLAIKKVAIASLIARHLWHEGQRNEMCKHLAGMLFYLEWPEADVLSLIAAVKDYTGDDDKTREKTIIQTFKRGAKGGKITGAATLRKVVEHPAVIDRITEWAGSEGSAILQEYNEKFAVVALEGKFRIAETVNVEKGEPPTLYGKDDFLNMQMADKVTVDEKNVQKALIWLNDPRRRTYKGIDFLPGLDDTAPVMNLWTGWPLEPDPLGKKGCEAYLDLLYYTICGEDDKEFAWLLHWFANIVREPMSKSMTAPVFIGRQGAGKSLAIGYFGKVLGHAYITITNEEHIYGRFNRHLGSALLVHSEEALYAGDKKHRGILKSLITDEFRMFEQKGVDAKRVRNFIRLGLSSNEEHAAPTEVDDRRYSVFHLKDRKIEPDRLKQVLTELNGNGPACLYHYLLNMKYDPMLARVNLKNEALANMKRMNLGNSVESWWYELLKAGQVLPDYLATWAQDPKASNEESTYWPAVVSSTALYGSMQHRMKERGARHIPDQTSFALLLDRMIFNSARDKKLKRKQKFFNNPMVDDMPPYAKQMGARHSTIFNMPSLQECRDGFALFLGQALDWDSDDPDSELHVQEQIQAKHDKF
jgi:hypothetical protein